MRPQRKPLRDRHEGGGEGQALDLPGSDLLLYQLFRRFNIRGRKTHNGGEGSGKSNNNSNNRMNSAEELDSPTDLSPRSPKGESVSRKSITGTSPGPMKRKSLSRGPSPGPHSHRTLNRIAIPEMDRESEAMHDKVEPEPSSVLRNEQNPWERPCMIDKEKKIEVVRENIDILYTVRSEEFAASASSSLQTSSSSVTLDRFDPFSPNFDDRKESWADVVRTLGGRQSGKKANVQYNCLDSAVGTIVRERK